MSVDPPPEDLLAHLARQVDELRAAGARVVLSPDEMAPHVLGMLSQQLPNGPLLVQVDVTKSLVQQASVLTQAFEFLFDEPVGAPWVHRSVSIGSGQLLAFRDLTIRARP